MTCLSSKHALSRFPALGRSVFVLAFVALAALVLAPDARAVRLFTSGFETDNFTETEWSFVDGTVGLTTTDPHAGTYAQLVQSGQTGRARRHLAANKTSGTLFTRLYIRFAALPGADTFVQQWAASTAVPANRIGVNSTGNVLLENEVTATLETGTETLSLNTWYRLELRHLLSDTVGELELRIYEGEATTALETLSITGEDTLPGNAVRVSFGFIVGAVDIVARIDDIAINDDAGTFQNSWAGAGRIVLLEPTFDDSVDWNANPAGSNAANVNDVPGTPDGDTTYNSINSAQTDRFHLPDLPAVMPPTATLTLAHVAGRARGEAAGDIRFLWWNEEGTQVSGPIFTFGTSYEIPATDEMLVVDLSTSTRLEVARSQMGYVHVSGGGPSNRVTALWANVEYTGEAPGGAGVSSRSDTISDSRPSVGSNHTIQFTVNTAIDESETVEVTWPAGFLFSEDELNCGDVDVATGSEFVLSATSIGCEATAAQWGVTFVTSSRTFILVAPTSTRVWVATGTQMTIEIGTNATSQFAGNTRITNPSAAGTYTVSVGGTFGGAGNMLVAIQAGLVVEAVVREHLTVSVSSVAAASCTADDGASVTVVNTTGVSVPFGTVAANAFYIGCQDVEVSTNAAGGYVLTVQEDGPMRTGAGDTIPDTNCDSGCDEITAGAWTNASNNGFGHTCRNQVNNDCNAEYANGTGFRRFPSVSGGTAGLSVKVATGSYTGDGSATSISHGLGTTPKVVMVWLDEEEDAGWVWRTSQHSGNTSIQFPTGSGNSRLASDMITGFDSSTFSLGTASSVNQTSSSYKWVAYVGTGVGTGTYTGNGVDNRLIPHGIGTTPKMLFVWRDTDNNTTGLCGRNNRHTGGNSICWQLGTNSTQRSAATLIEAMDGTNFQVGTSGHVNANGSAYQWVALTGPSVETGAYTGNGNDDRDIPHSLSVTPVAILVFRDTNGGNVGPVVRTDQYTGSTAIEFSEEALNTQRSSNFIQKMSATSFQVGNTVEVNNSGNPYKWFAVKTSGAQSEKAGETLMASSTRVSIAVGRVKFRLSVGASQGAGTYTNVITYIVTPTF